ncbi:MAG: hypothetical protein WA703_22130 [Pseudolabrys sp.]
MTKSKGSLNALFNQPFIDFPDAGNGMMWPQNYKEPNECKTVATAILSALKNAGYKITAGSN